MATVSKPMDFSPAFGEVIYEIKSSGNESALHIAILDDRKEQALGSKRLKGSNEYQVNVSAYLKPQANIRPCDKQNCGIGYVANRTLNSAIELEGNIASAPHTLGICRPKEDGKMTDAPDIRYIREGEQDEIPLLAESGAIECLAEFHRNDGDDVRITLSSMNLTEKEAVVAIINTEHLKTLLETEEENINSFHGFDVEISNGGRITQQVRYILRPHSCNGVRLCWWNKYGAIDYHTFESVGDSYCKISKETADISGCRKVLSSKEERFLDITTGFRKQAENEWITQIASAPKVWLAEEAGFIPVEVVCDKVITGSESEDAIRVTLKYQECETFQTL